jgi:hypothetical protein
MALSLRLAGIDPAKAGGGLWYRDIGGAWVQR